MSFKTKIVKFFVEFTFPQSKIKGYNVLARKSGLFIIGFIFPIILLSFLGVCFIMVQDEKWQTQLTINILGYLILLLDLFLIIKIIYYIFQPRILIYENGESLIINGKYMVNIKDITHFYRKEVIEKPSKTKYGSNHEIVWWGNIYIIVDDKKFVVRNVFEPLDVLDYLYKKKQQKKYK